MTHDTERNPPRKEYRFDIFIIIVGIAFCFLSIDGKENLLGALLLSSLGIVIAGLGLDGILASEEANPDPETREIILSKRRLFWERSLHIPTHTLETELDGSDSFFELLEEWWYGHDQNGDDWPWYRWFLSGCISIIVFALMIFDPQGISVGESLLSRMDHHLGPWASIAFAGIIALACFWYAYKKYQHRKMLLAKAEDILEHTRTEIRILPMHFIGISLGCLAFYSAAFTFHDYQQTQREQERKREAIARKHMRHQDDDIRRIQESPEYKKGLELYQEYRKKRLDKTQPSDTPGS